MKKQDILSLLYQKNYIIDNINIQDLKVGTNYNFKCDKGHIFNSILHNVYQSGNFACPCCSGHRTISGETDINTKDKEMAKHLVNTEDSYKYSIGSNKLLLWKCAICGTTFKCTPLRIKEKHYCCTDCNVKGRSFPEKVIYSFLLQSCYYIEREKQFDWSERKRYDFYIPSLKCIIEVNGKQHYSEQIFSKHNGKTLLDQEYNDLYKKEMALSHKEDVQHYIVIDCRKSDFAYIKHNILNSDLLFVLKIFKDEIDWEECYENIFNDIDIQMFKDYDNGLSIKQLVEKYSYSRNTITAKLKNGNKIGICSYTLEVSTQRNNKLKSEFIKNSMSKPVVQYDLQGNYIAEFDSIQETQRQLKIYHICDCLKGKRKQCGGFIWKYKN